MLGKAGERAAADLRRKRGYEVVGAPLEAVKYVRFRFSLAGRKHGMTSAQMRFAVNHCGLAFVQPPPGDLTEPDRMLLFGDDQAGVQIEILALDDDSGAWSSSMR